MHLGFPSAQNQPDFANDGLGDYYIDALDLGQARPANALEFTAEVEVRQNIGWNSRPGPSRCAGWLERW